MCLEELWKAAKERIADVGFEVFTVVVMKNIIWDMTLCSPFQLTFRRNISPPATCVFAGLLNLFLRP
jgi:hypothetical protein